MLARLKTPALLMVAGGLGIGIGSLLVLISKEREKVVNQSGYLKKADEFVRTQPVVASLLGESFELGKAKLTDGWSRMSNDSVQVKVPIKGDKDNGALFVYASRQDPNTKYKLVKIEMTFDKIKGKKMVLMDLEHKSGSVAEG